MVAIKQKPRVSSRGFDPQPAVSQLAGRVHHYFDQHPEVAREKFILDAVRRELCFREQRKTRNVVGNARRDGEGINRRFMVRPPSDDDLRFGALLAQRLAAIHYERYGLWPKLRRFLFR